jgi:hypothetical protein
MQPVDKCKARRLLRPQASKVVEPWLICRITLYAYKRKRAYAAMRTWTALEPGSRVALLLRGAGGAVFQVPGFVKRSAAGEGYHRVEVQIPWSAAVSLAAWAGRAVKEGATAVLHNYVARIKGAALPPLKLIYEGYVALRDTLIYKVVDAPPGIYFLELHFGGVPVLFPTKYYKHERKNKQAGGDSGAFSVPLDALYTFHAWGLHELGSDYDYVYVRVWKPEPRQPSKVAVDGGGALRW